MVWTNPSDLTMPTWAMWMKLSDFYPAAWCRSSPATSTAYKQAFSSLSEGDRRWKATILGCVSVRRVWWVDHYISAPKSNAHQLIPALDSHHPVTHKASVVRSWWAEPIYYHQMVWSVWQKRRNLWTYWRRTATHCGTANKELQEQWFAMTIFQSRTIFEDIYSPWQLITSSGV